MFFDTYPVLFEFSRQNQIARPVSISILAHKTHVSMCMGFGCNACGVTGCRIIDSPRERLIAILTNSFAPCNGRFPLLIFLCAVFFDAGSAGGALLLTGVIAGSVQIGRAHV